MDTCPSPLFTGRFCFRLTDQNLCLDGPLLKLSPIVHNHVRRYSSISFRRFSLLPPVESLSHRGLSELYGRLQSGRLLSLFYPTACPRWEGRHVLTPVPRKGRSFRTTGSIESRTAPVGRTLTHPKRLDALEGQKQQNWRRKRVPPIVFSRTLLFQTLEKQVLCGPSSFTTSDRQ